MPWINNHRSREGVLAEVPVLASLHRDLYASLWEQTHIPVVTLELCRLRLASLHRCDAEILRSDVELPAGKRDNLANWHNGTQFTHAERSCLEFTEVYAMDVQAITDDQAESVKSHYGDAGLVLLIEALGVFDGMARLSLLWQLPVTRED